MTGEVLHGEAHIVVLADGGADAGLFDNEDTCGADLAADLFVLQVSEGGDVLAEGHNHGLHHIVIGIGEEVFLLAFGRDGGGRGNDVIFACGYAGEDAVPRHVHDFEFYAQFFAHFMEQIHGKANGLFVLIEEFHGRPVAVAGDPDFLAGHGRAGRKRQGKGAEKKNAAEHIRKASLQKMRPELPWGEGVSPGRATMNAHCP